ncbi:MAG: suppressor of fused domain protein [Proteobacteria bacterium]|nr:suppressor of fused domain protein [Pseudomonadota bacterium]
MSSKSDEGAVSRGGSLLLRHGEEDSWKVPLGEECIEEISNHIEAHLGPVETVFHEIASDTVHVDVHFVKPTEHFPFARLVTSGMSDLPMPVPEGADVPRYTELLVTLPKSWRLDQASFKDESWYWPVRLIKTLARFPHKHATWLGWGHTIPNGDPPAPYAPGTSLCGAIILPSITVPDGFHELQIDKDKKITFYSVLPLYEEEMQLKLNAGSGRLLDRLDRVGINDIIDPKRRNVAKRRFGFF